MTCHPMSSHAIPSHPVPCHATPCHAMPCHAMPCHTMPCHPMSSHAIPSHPMPHHPMPRHAMPRHAIPSHPIPSSSIAGQAGPRLATPQPACALQLQAGGASLPIPESDTGIKRSTLLARDRPCCSQVPRTSHGDGLEKVPPAARRHRLVQSSQSCHPREDKASHLPRAAHCGAGGAGTLPVPRGAPPVSPSPSFSSIFHSSCFLRKAGVSRDSSQMFSAAHHIAFLMKYSWSLSAFCHESLLQLPAMETPCRQHSCEAARPGLPAPRSPLSTFAPPSSSSSRRQCRSRAFVPSAPAGTAPPRAQPRPCAGDTGDAAWPSPTPRLGPSVAGRGGGWVRTPARRHLTHSPPKPPRGWQRQEP